MGPSKTLSWMDTFFIAVVIVNTLKKAPLPAVAKENWILFLWKKKKSSANIQPSYSITYYYEKQWLVYSLEVYVHVCTVDLLKVPKYCFSQQYIKSMASR